MKLSKLKIKDFKRIEEVEFNLGDINILVGINGCGKSSIIQATHLACCVMRQAERVERNKTSTVGIDQLDYLPTDNYKMLGHKINWGNKTGTPSSKIELTFNTDEGADVSALCELRSARNAGISITGNIPSQLTDYFRKKRSYFSAYIPGISGIPNKEEKRAKKVILKACAYGDSNIILRNALLLLKETSQDNISIIENWLSQIIGVVKIDVSYDDNRDLYINCNIGIDGDNRPIELIGTGYLQLVQIFSYILLFKPGILLIDEPDIHLHPSIQEKLVQLLAQVANERNLRILLTTHSPFIVRGAPLSTNVYWVKDGFIESANRKAVELALGWGAFGKKIILISEDTDTKLLKKIISQWPELEKYVTFYPGTGYKNIATPEQAYEIYNTFDGKYRIVVHRDRDSLTDDEVSCLVQKYGNLNITLWFPILSDIESYFCQTEFISSFIGCSINEATEYVETILNNQGQTIDEQFTKQRRAHNEELYSAGGSPNNLQVWNSFQSRPLRGAKGKFVFRQLKNSIPRNFFREESVLNCDLNVEIAPELKVLLEGILND